MKKKVIISLTVVVLGYLSYLFFSKPEVPKVEDIKIENPIDSTKIVKDTIVKIQDSIK